jgi:hypothetical protein
MENNRAVRDDQMIKPIEETVVQENETVSEPILDEQMIQPRLVEEETEEPTELSTPKPVVEVAVPMTLKKRNKRKRCTKGKRRNKKTHRCNKKCPEGYKRSSIKKRCVKK